MPPQYFPPDRQPPGLPPARVVGYGLLAVLGLTVGWFALTAQASDARPPVEVIPAQTIDQAGVSEQRLTLTDGRVLTCLTFPGPAPAVSCDWSRAYHR